MDAEIKRIRAEIRKEIQPFKDELKRLHDEFTVYLKEAKNKI